MKMGIDSKNNITRQFSMPELLVFGFSSFKHQI